MKKITVVIQYEDKQPSPSFYADMECLGGKVVEVMFDDALRRLDIAEDSRPLMKTDDDFLFNTSPVYGPRIDNY
tara:strand:- start:945 stop:1166 length:222 start_codon:yes stop_codon:yes gene_type:complete